MHEKNKRSCESNASPKVLIGKLKNYETVVLKSERTLPYSFHSCGCGHDMSEARQCNETTLRQVVCKLVLAMGPFPLSSYFSSHSSITTISSR
jgi:hypothetical protein